MVASGLKARGLCASWLPFSVRELGRFLLGLPAFLFASRLIDCSQGSCVSPWVLHYLCRPVADEGDGGGPAADYCLSIYGSRQALVGCLIEASGPIQAHTPTTPGCSLQSVRAQCSTITGLITFSGCKNAEGTGIHVERLFCSIYRKKNCIF